MAQYEQKTCALTSFWTFSEISRLKAEFKQANDSNQDDLQKLKRSLQELESLIEKKNSRIFTNIHKQRSLLVSLQKTIARSHSDLIEKSAYSFE